MTEIVRNIYLLSKIVRIDSVNNLKLRSHIYHHNHNIRNTTLHTIFHVLFLFICLNFSNKSKIKCETNAAAISGGMSHTMFPVIFVSILLYNLQKIFFSTFQQISMSNSHRTSCEFLKDIFGRISGANSGARWSPSRIQCRGAAKLEDFGLKVEVGKCVSSVSSPSVGAEFFTLKIMEDKDLLL